MTDMRNPRSSMFPADKPMQRAVVKFDPTEQLHELLYEFLNEDARRRLGNATLSLTLDIPPYVYTEQDALAHRVIEETKRDIKSKSVAKVPVAKRWAFRTDGNSERAARHLKISIPLGKNSLTDYLRASPLARRGGSLGPLAAAIVLAREDLPISPGELEHIHRSVEDVLNASNPLSVPYAGNAYRLENPRLLLESRIANRTGPTSTIG